MKLITILILIAGAVLALVFTAIANGDDDDYAV